MKYFISLEANPTTQPPWTTLPPPTTPSTTTPTRPIIPSTDDSLFFFYPQLDQTGARYYEVDENLPVQAGADFFPLPFFTAPILDVEYNDTCISIRITPEFKTREQIVLYKVRLKCCQTSN